MAGLQGGGSASALVFVILLLSVLLHGSYAVVYNVGDRQAWSLPAPNYRFWASMKQFRVNDVLRFTYIPALHNVVQVTAADYLSCSSNRPIAVFSNGNSFVQLPKKGNFYFICGVPGHCQNGMKVAVTVR